LADARALSRVVDCVRKSAQVPRRRRKAGVLAVCLCQVREGKKAGSHQGRLHMAVYGGVKQGRGSGLARIAAPGLAFLAVMLLVVAQTVAAPVTEQQAKRVAQVFLEAQKLRWRRSPRYGPEVLRDVRNANILVGEVKEVKGKGGGTLAYVAAVSPQGFVIVSPDTDIRPVVGYSFKGRFPFEDSTQNALLHLVKWDMEARLAYVRGSNATAERAIRANNTRWQAYIRAEPGLAAELATASQWGPLITTHWHQRDPYNRYCPDDPNPDPGYPLKCAVGCTATAMTGILNYWRYPPGGVWFSDPGDHSGDGYTTSTRHIRIPEQAATLHFPTFATLNSELSSIDYYDDGEDVADTDIPYLCFGAGIKLEMNYKNSASGAWQSASVYLEDFGYGSATQEPYPWPDLEGRFIENIQSGWPVQVAISRPPTGEEIRRKGHSLIMDGYKSTAEFHFHFNWGWGGTRDDVWYNPPDLTPYDVVNHAVYDICPFQGWNQYGADGSNSFRSRYSAPTEALEKWQVSCSTDYHFNGLVVGTGNKIYASCCPVVGSADYHPRVWVVSRYGVKEKEIVLYDENEGITYPAQNWRGDIFVATDLGRVYRIDAATDTATRIFTEPGGNQFFWPVKVDEQGNIYACTQDKLYSLTSSGTVRWTFDPPGDRWFPSYREIPAIDSVRHRVYISSYSDEANRAYLSCLSQFTGAVLTERVFDDVEYNFQCAGVPAIDDNGTVYVGCKTVLYALNPDNVPGPPIWTRDFSPAGAWRPTPAIGWDGTIYFPYWKLDGAWSLVFAALNPADGSTKWQVPLSADVETDDIHEPYAALAFGPGATLYVIPTTGRGHTIYAVSEGAVGDPDGAGEGWTDNEPPEAPSNPTPADGAQDVTTSFILSWTCGDPEGQSLKYDVYLGDAGLAMVPIAVGLTSESCVVEGLAAGTCLASPRDGSGIVVKG